jgi:hypothetical protein
MQPIRTASGFDLKESNRNPKSAGLVSDTGDTLAITNPRGEIQLANALTTTLDENAQHDDEQYAGDNTNKRDIVHV